ncbi:uncharacterized protein LOC114300216 isoform X2 [Camellia sinensis]|uniref:uncharacterized protein LOC114300216 isoform X2 n=1 Tax=Camellia sinensis TaxID=4442 RepID=UPI0010367A69|nr:uncharacterized protein LOC114300216 isoform X2 [Camellia sinensis]
MWRKTTFAVKSTSQISIPLLDFSSLPSFRLVPEKTEESERKGNQDSDQSISDEDLAHGCSENCIALGGTTERKGGLQIQSQLGVFRDTHERDHGTTTAILFNQRQTCFSSEDEVEIPVFHDKGDFISSPMMASTCNLGEEIISDDEKIGHGIPGSEKQGGECTWSAVTKEAEALVHLIENARSSSLHAVTSNVNRPCKGARGKAKAKSKSKFLFRFRSHKADIPLSQELETVDNRTTENSMVELLENFQGEKMEQSEIFDMPAEVAPGHELPEHSMAELLDNYQEKTGLPLENSKMYTRMKGRSEQPIDERNISPSGKRNMDKEDPPEALDSGSSSDDEVSPCANVQNLGLIIPESKQKTMTDKFQEAFGSAAINDEGPHFALHDIGIFAKLQRVMQSEKKRELDFLKKLQTGTSSNDEARCIDVEILSRCLEAKLTVCCCSLSRDKESSKWAETPQMAKENRGRTLMIIFSSRVCDDVELEVGNLIRIHSPWKQVQVGGKDEAIILSAYFSQISS